MPNKYPEHIDEIDDFYRSQLADLEITPPDGLWDKIGIGPFEAQEPDQIDAPAGEWSLTQKLIGWVVATVVVVGSLFYWGQHNDSQEAEKQLPPTIEEPSTAPDSVLQQTVPDASFNEKRPTTTPSSSVQAVPPHNSVQEIPEDKAHVEATEQKESPQVTEPAPVQNQVDSLKEVQSLEPKKKEKMKFKDKYKKEYQDSTRKIFVPGK